MFDFPFEKTKQKKKNKFGTSTGVFLFVSQNSSEKSQSGCDVSHCALSLCSCRCAATRCSCRSRFLGGSARSQNVTQQAGFGGIYLGPLVGKVWLSAAILCVIVHARVCVCVQGGNRFEWLGCVSFPSWQTACVPEASAVGGAKSESAGSANHWAPRRDDCKWT